jgi:hypothetical protein
MDDKHFMTLCGYLKRIENRLIDIDHKLEPIITHQPNTDKIERSFDALKNMEGIKIED